MPLEILIMLQMILILMQFIIILMEIQKEELVLENYFMMKLEILHVMDIKNIDWFKLQIFQDIQLDIIQEDLFFVMKQYIIIIVKLMIGVKDISI